MNYLPRQAFLSNQKTERLSHSLSYTVFKMNKKSGQDTQNGVIKRPAKWDVRVDEKKHHREEGCNELPELEENDQFENFVHWDIDAGYLAISHPTKFTILSQGNGTPKSFRIGKFPGDFEPSKTIIFEDIDSDIAAVGDTTRVLLGPFSTKFSITEEQVQSLRLTDSRRKSTISMKQEFMPEQIASLAVKGWINGAECGTIENPGQKAGLRVDTVGLSILLSTEGHNEVPQSAILPSGTNCITQAMKSKYEIEGIKAIYSTLRSKGLTNDMTKQFCADLASKATKGELRIAMQTSLGNNASRLSQNQGNTFFTVSRITISSTVDLNNQSEVTAFTHQNLYEAKEANSLAGNAGFLWLESKDDNIKNQPRYSYTRLTSDNTVIGNYTEILLPYKGNGGRSKTQVGYNTRPSTMARNLVFQAPQYLKFLVLNHFPKAYPNVLHTTGAMAKAKHTKVINYCQDLRYSGKFHEHGRILDHYRCEVGQKDPDCLVSFNLEEAWALFKNSNVTAANKSLETTKAIAVKAKNSSLLLGRIYVFMANIQLVQNDYKEALKMLDIGSYYLQYFASGDEKTFLCYMYGLALMMLAGECRSPNEELEQKALKFFDLYLQHAKIRKCCAEFVRRGINCVMFKKATMHLRTYSNVIRDCKVSSRALEMAKECLKVVEDAPEIAKEYDTKNKIMSIKSDIAYREKELEKEKDIVMEETAALV